MPSRDPAERALIARIAAHERWAGTPDRTTATEKARRAAMDRFEREVDPDGMLAPEIRAKLAASKRSAYFARLARMASQARRARRQAANLDNTVAGELAAFDDDQVA